MGRPSTYSESIAAAICERLADGESLRSICGSDDFPVKSTVFKWLGENKEFSDQYARARETQAEGFYDELLAIADDESGDVTGELEMPNAVAVQRSKLRVETRKWAMSKILAKKYGEKVTQEHTGEVIARVVSDL